MGLDKLEELCKTVDPKNIKTFLRNAKIMNDKKAKMEDRVRAAENVYAINMAHTKKNPGAPPLKELAAELAPELSNPVVQNTAPAEIKNTQPVPPAAVPFHEEFAQHHGVDPVKFKATFAAMNPEQQKMTQDYHAQHLASKVAKSVNTLYDLFEQLKKQL